MTRNEVTKLPCWSESTCGDESRHAMCMFVLQHAFFSFALFPFFHVVLPVLPVCFKDWLVCFLVTVSIVANVFTSSRIFPSSFCISPPVSIISRSTSCSIAFIASLGADNAFHRLGSSCVLQRQPAVCLRKLNPFLFGSAFFHSYSACLC